MSISFKKKSSITNPEITDLHIRIDQVDKELLQILELRADLVFQLGHLKKQNDLPLYDPSTEQESRTKIRSLVSKDCVLKVDEMGSLFTSIVECYRNLEEFHMNKDQVLNSTEKTLIDFSKPHTVVLFNFGYLSSSLYLALNNSLPLWNFKVFGKDIDADAFERWKKDRGVENIELINKDQLRTGEIFILGGCAESNKSLITDFEFPKSAIVFDIGEGNMETVTHFQQQCERKYQSYTFIGGRPRIYSELTSFEYADASLFYGKTFCWVTPNPRFVEFRTQATFDRFAKLIGAKPVWTDVAG